MKTCPFCAESIQDAAILCRFCGRELPDGAPAIVAQAVAEKIEPPADTRPSPIKRTKVSAGRILAWIAVGYLVLLLLAFFSPKTPLSRTVTPAAVPSTATAPIAPASPPSAQEPAAPPPEKPESSWIYHDWTDELTGKPVYSASVISTNTFNLDFPYSGEQHASLRLRKHPRFGSDVILTIERGQFLCSLGECSVLVSFDSAAPAPFSAGEPSDNSSDTLFIRNYTRFVQRLQKAKEVRVAASLYQAGQPTFMFDVRGWQPKRLGPTSPSR